VVAFWVAGTSALESAVYVSRVEVHRVLWVSRVSADSFRCHFAGKGISLCHFSKASPGVCLFQPSSVDAPDTQHPASSLLGLRREVSTSDTAVPRLWCAKTGICPFWPYSILGTSRTVPSVHDLLGFAIVADMLNTYRKLVAASNNAIPLLPLLYMLL